MAYIDMVHFPVNQDRHWFRLWVGHTGPAARIHKVPDAAGFIDVPLSGMLHGGGSI